MSGFGSSWMPRLTAAGRIRRRPGRSPVYLAAALVLSLAAVVVLVRSKSSGASTRPSTMWRGFGASSRGRSALAGFRPDCGGRISYGQAASDGVPQGFVRVVVRTHQKELSQLQFLIQSMRAQAADSFNVDFVLVPTEPGQQKVYRAFKSEVEECYGDIMLLDVPDSFYADARASNPYTCTEEERGGYRVDWGTVNERRLCDSKRYVDAMLTDRALHDFITTCRYCTHVMVTDASHGRYTSEIVAEALDGEADIVVAGLTQGRLNVTRMVDSDLVDLLAIVLRPRVLEGGRRLILNTLPEGARARELYGAGYWFVKRAVECGYSYALIEDRVSSSHQ